MTVYSIQCTGNTLLLCLTVYMPKATPNSLNKIYMRLDLLLKKHWEVEVQESIFRHHFQNKRKFENNDFHYHRDIIYNV